MLTLAVTSQQVEFYVGCTERAVPMGLGIAMLLDKGRLWSKISDPVRKMMGWLLIVIGAILFVGMFFGLK